MLAPFGDGTAVYDLLLHQVTVVNAVAGHLIEVLGLPSASVAAGFAELVDVLVAVTDVSRDDTTAHLRSLAAELTESGLLGRREEWTPPAVLSGSTQVGIPDLHVSPTVALLDHRLAFRSSDLSTIDAVVRLLQLRPSADPPTVYFDVEPTSGDGVVLIAEEEWDFPTRSGFEIQLPGAINDFVARSDGLLVMHAGAVRTPSGEVVLLPGAPEAGKSTLTAALVMAGCDYLGDELIGIRPDTLAAVGMPRPLVLDDTSLEVLGLGPLHGQGPYVSVHDLRRDAVAIEGEAGVTSRIVLARFDGTADATRREELNPRSVLEALLGSVMNITRCGEPGWRAICQLAERVPTTVIAHSDATELAANLLT